MKKLISILAVFLLSLAFAIGQSTSPIGVKLIKSFESISLKAYKCPAGVWTIGYGNTSRASPGKIITKEVAEQYLIADLRKFENSLNRTVGRSLIWHEFDALISFTFNLGSGVLKGDLLANINRGSPKVSEQILRYNKAKVGGKLKELKGLTRRRNAESRLYCSGKFG